MCLADRGGSLAKNPQSPQLVVDSKVLAHARVCQSRQPKPSVFTLVLFHETDYSDSTCRHSREKPPKLSRLAVAHPEQLHSQSSSVVTSLWRTPLEYKCS